MKKNNQGVSLLELIICIAIVAILASFALPYYHQYRAEQEAKLLPQLINMHIYQAKNYALTYHHEVVICSSQDMQKCENQQWNTGLLMFIDKNRNRQLDQDEQVLARTVLKIQYGQLSWRGALSKPSLFFKADTGLPRGSNGSFYYCASYAPRLHQRIYLNQRGLLRTEGLSNC